MALKRLKIAENTRSILSSFKRNDRRIRQKLYAKYGRRKRSRIKQLLHRVSKVVTQKAKQDRTALVLEEITHIRKLYQRGNGQGKHYRGKMNDWSFAEIKRLITYKAAWEGIPVIQLNRAETRNTSKLCPRCGKRTQVAERADLFHRRQLLCLECNKWMDRDVAAAMNLSIRGWLRFSHSKGDAGEAMKGNPERDPVVLRADASKSGLVSIVCPKPDRTILPCLFLELAEPALYLADYLPLVGVSCVLVEVKVLFQSLLQPLPVLELVERVFPFL